MSWRSVGGMLAAEGKVTYETLDEPKDSVYRAGVAQVFAIGETTYEARQRLADKLDALARRLRGQ